MARNTEQIASLFAAVGFKVDRKSLKDVETSLKGIEDKLTRIRAGFVKVRANRSLERMFLNVGKGAEGAAKGVDKLTTSFQRGEGPVVAYTGAITALAGAMASLRASMAGMPLPRVPNTTGGLTGGSRGSGGAAVARGGWFSRAASGLFSLEGGALARGLIPGLGAGWAISQATTKAREMMATENALSALTGSQSAGKAEMSWLTNFANTYGLRASESASGYKRILASSVGTKMEGQQAKDIFRGVSLYGKTLGLSDENMSRATTAISQMMSKGKVSAEELKGQLAEAIPGAVQIFSNALGKPVDQMFKMMEDGQLLAEDILPQAAAYMEKMASRGGALQRAMKTSASEQARFMNQWEIFLKRLFESGLDEVLAKVFKSLTWILEKVVELIDPLMTIGGMFLVWRAHLALVTFVPLIAQAWQFVKAMWAANAAIAVMSGQSTWAGLLAMLKTLGARIALAWFPLYIILDTLLGMMSDKYSIIEEAVARTGASNWLSDKLTDMFGPTPEEGKPKNGGKPLVIPNMLKRPDGAPVEALPKPFKLPVDDLGSVSQKLSSTGPITININGGDLVQVRRTVEEVMQGTIQRTYNNYSEEWNS